VLAVASIFRDIDNLEEEAAMEHAAAVERARTRASDSSRLE